MSDQTGAPRSGDATEANAGSRRRDDILRPAKVLEATK